MQSHGLAENHDYDQLNANRRDSREEKQQSQHHGVPSSAECMMIGAIQRGMCFVTDVLPYLQSGLDGVQRCGQQSRGAAP